MIITNTVQTVRAVQQAAATQPKIQMPQKMVYICSPYKGDIKRNKVRARMYCRFAFDCGYTPIAPHLYFPQFLDEDNEQERKLGLQYGLLYLLDCVEVWVFGHRISEGMGQEIRFAGTAKIPVRYFTEDTEERKSC